MAELLHIAIDAMSGDRGPSTCVPAALAAAHEFPGVRFTLIGRQADLERETSNGRTPSNLACVFAAQVVEMTDHPREALRRKKDSSMRRALDLVKAREANACVSAGNTGALMAMAHFVLKMLPGVERPAIGSLIPSRGGHTYMLDLGANASATPEQLLQFGVMGSILAADLEGAHDRPRVGLLNIGEEEIKGHEIVQAAHNLLTASGLNYVGFVEGHDIFSDKVDVVVTDGFTGNVALKLLEGTIRELLDALREEVGSTWRGKLGGLLIRPAARTMRTRLDPDTYGGAYLLGLRGLAVIAHGNSGRKAVANAIRLAARGVDHRVVERLAERLPERVRV